MSDTGSQSVDVDAEKQSISTRTEEWFAVEARRDMEASLSFMTPDVIIHTEGSPAIVGLDAARTLYEEFFKIPHHVGVVLGAKVVFLQHAFEATAFKFCACGLGVDQCTIQRVLIITLNRDF